MRVHLSKFLLAAIAGAALMVALGGHALAEDYNGYYQDQSFNGFLANHPKVGAELRANPGLINDPGWRHQHPDLQQYLQNHPRVAHNVTYEAAQMNGRWGAYDERHEWHDADWWHDNHPDWFWKNHPDWAKNHPKWREEWEHHHDHDHD